ncbi:LysE family translocator [Nonomuraea endophytica]|uniref:Threonine/homoserine/homoserine lactone efflux protein n=1 Tax=Nonomuraea endophytica TaxID=714136 RepID=A0A7W7ZYQ1_9ACTN|nr:LysE family translocator [Nonomuraea endophytica]MBB5076291.1 threonine/homoserine/homoserine lactone efflux protein [Nonomuraea endophytica]
MDIAGSIASFAAVVALLTLTPGLDTALIMRTSVLSGRRPAWGVVLGIQTGILVWGLATAAGLSALFAASQLAYEILRWAGVAYLVYMGARMLWNARHPARSEADPVTDQTFGRAFRRGLLTNLLNPKVGAFYVAMLPQFIPDDVPPALMGLALAGVHVGEGLVWSALLVAFATFMGGVLRTPRVRRLLDRLTGVVIIGFGVRLAVQD